MAESIAEFHNTKLPKHILHQAEDDRFTILKAIFRINSKKRKEAANNLENADFKLGLVHGDLHFLNFVYNDEDDRLYLLDYETTHYGWLEYDWAVFFIHDVYGQSTLPEASVIGRQAACRKLRMHLLETYLKHTALLEGNTDSDVPRSDVERLYTQIVDVEVMLQSFYGNRPDCGA